MKLELGTSAWRAALLASVLLIAHDVRADPGNGGAIESVASQPTAIGALGAELGGKLDAGLSAPGLLAIERGGKVISDFDHMIIAKPARSLRERMSYGMKFFVERGYSTTQAAGIVGNLAQESAIDPMTKSGDKGTAHGIAQWRGKRFARLKAFANKAGTSWRDFNTQLAFVDHELKNHETFAYRRLMAARNVDEATVAMISFERPRGWTPQNPRRGHGWGKRRAYARDALQFLASL